MEREGHIRPNGSQPGSLQMPGAAWAYALELLVAKDIPTIALNSFLSSSAHKACLDDKYINLISVAHIAVPGKSFGGYFVVILGETY